MGSVAANYVHRDKLCAPKGCVTLSGIPLKWYDIGAADEPVPDAIRDLALAYLKGAEPALDGDVGFVMLHRCGDGEFYFLLVQTWLGNNEIWKTTFCKDRSDADFRLFPLEESHKGTFCVWEAGVVAHEVSAWKRYLRSARDDAAKQAYLDDAYVGTV